LQAEHKIEKSTVYQAPAPFMTLFYGILLVWTAGTAPLIWQKFQRGGFQGDWLFGAMIGFFYLYSWYWALGLFYRIALDGEGMVRMKSFRRTLEIETKEVRAIEGSRLPGGFGFIRLKLPRESVYLFCHRMDVELEGILREIRKANPLIRTARI
jgi:hypothetical protein